MPVSRQVFCVPEEISPVEQTPFFTGPSVPRPLCTLLILGLQSRLLGDSGAFLQSADPLVNPALPPRDVQG